MEIDDEKLHKQEICDNFLSRKCDNLEGIGRMFMVGESKVSYQPAIFSTCQSPQRASSGILKRRVGGMRRVNPN